MLAETTQIHNCGPVSIWQISLLEDLMANYLTCRKSSGTMIQMMHILFHNQHPKYNVVLSSPQIHCLLVKGLFIMQVIKVQHESL